MDKVILMILVIVLIIGIIVLATIVCKQKIEVEGWVEDFEDMKAAYTSARNKAIAATSETSKLKSVILVQDKQIENLKLQIAALSAKSENQQENDDEIAEITVAGTSRKLPDGHTNWYPLEPYLTITDKTSQQWALQLECETDPYTSIRQYIKNGEAYDCVAIGNMAECEIGDAWKITFRSGFTRNVICGDWTASAPDDTSSMPDIRRPADCKTGVLEFIVDYSRTDSRVKFAGTLGEFFEFGGNTVAGDIIEWQYLGKVWKI